MGFSDHFSSVSASYAAFRPRYPSDLFAFLSSICPRCMVAWDCATGTGQAAVALAAYFKRVYATDASAAQIAQAEPHPRVEYSVAPSEASALAAGSVELITVAQALHWFDLERFYAEARRVLAPDGVIAVWTYGRLRLDAPEVQRTVDHLYDNVVGPYWPEERQMVEDGYRSIPFPFEELAVPEFEIRDEMSATQLEGYLRTWSATQRFAREGGYDPVEQLGLARRVSTPIQVRWPLSLRVGR